MPDLNQIDFEEASAEEALDKLDTDPDRGLTEDEVSERQEQYGKNAVEEEESHPIRDFFGHFWGAIPWMLEIACALSAFAGRWEDFFVIFGMLVINGGVSYWHDRKAQKAVEALKERLAPEAHVIRDGEEKKISAEELVPGDVVILRRGNLVPADAKLLADGDLRVDESVLTGESVPVDKGEADMAYDGTSVSQGEARAVVTATGTDTHFAHTVALVASAEETSHFRRAVLRIGYFLIAAAAVLVLAVVVVSLLRGEPATEVLLFALVLTIASIPAALPAVLTVTMAVGARRLARMEAIVTHLPAMEEMAGLQVLCADKTGTLTKNELELQDPVLFAADDEDELVRMAALTARRNTADPIDSAVLDGLADASVLDDFDVVDFEPFNSTNKRAEAEVKHDGETFHVAKGAPQVILDLCDPDEDLHRTVSDRVDEMGEQGYRTLGVARSDDGDRWRYLGLLVLLDPPRDDTKEVLDDARRHNIDVRMVTGDHRAIARQVAGQVGLGQNIVAVDRSFDSGGEDAVTRDGFAEVTPEDKYKLIQRFQENDRIVGMTGDGVNDAPALKQADIGIAVSGATDAARAASDLVLTKPGLGVITRAIEEARRIFERMTSYATYRITETIRVLLFISLSIFAFDFYPVTPIMVVLLALLNDIPIMTIATDRAPTPDRPARWNMKRVLTLASLLGVAGVVSAFILFWYAQTQMSLPDGQVQTLVFLKLLVAGHFTIYITRNRGWFWQKPWPSWTLFLSLEATQIVGTLFAVFGWLVTPIPLRYALYVWAYAFVWLFLIDGVKQLAEKVLPISTEREKERQEMHRHRREQHRARHEEDPSGAPPAPEQEETETQPDEAEESRTDEEGGVTAEDLRGESEEERAAKDSGRGGGSSS